MFPEMYQDLGPRLLSMGYELQPSTEDTDRWCWLLKDAPLLRRIVILADETVTVEELKEIVKAAIMQWRTSEGLFRIGIISANTDRELALLSEITWIGAIWLFQNSGLRPLYSEGRWNAEDSLLRRHYDGLNPEADRVERVSLYDKPRWSYLFLAVNILVFLIATFMGGSEESRVLVSLGAKDSARIWLGEYWRLITPLFFHVGYAHLFFNSVALFRIGPIVERLFGGVRFIVIYLLAGIGGVLASIIGLPYESSAGASGAIFGLLGALIYFSRLKPRAASAYFGNNLWVVLGINLVLGFTVRGIDNYGHIGGLVCGFLVAAVLGLNPRDRSPHRSRWLIGTLALFIAMTFFSLRPPANAWHVPFDKGRTALLNRDYDTAIEQYVLSLERAPKNNNARRQLSFSCLIRGVQLMDEGNFIQAVERFKLGTRAFDLWQHHYHMAIAYYKLEQFNDALREMKIADKLKPRDKAIQDDIKRIEQKLP